VLGDKVYGVSRGPRAPIAAHRQMLHARLLAFSHPVTGEQVRVESPLPEDFVQALAAARATGGRDRR